MADFAYRFAAPDEASNGASTILLDMADPADRAFGASMMERLSFPTIRHARRAVSDAQRRVTEARAELRRILAMRPDYTDRWDRLARPPGWVWGQARIECRRIRAARRSLARARDRVRRYLEEALQEAFASSPPPTPGVLTINLSNQQKAA